MRAAYLLVLLVLFLLIGCAAEEPSAPGTTEPEGGTGTGTGTTAQRSAREASVDILDDAFDPAEVTIRVGGKVKWKNTDTKTHVIAGPKRLFSQKLLAGEDFSFTFEEAGEYEITNVLAPIFQGKVIVK